MKNKVLVLIFVPALEISFEFYIPINRKIYTIKNSIVEFIQGEFGLAIKSAGRVLMLDKESGIIFDENLYVTSHDKLVGDLCKLEQDNIVKQLVNSRIWHFYGRWLRESPDIYQFLWNEYPWSDSYKFVFEDGEWEESECPVNTMLAAIIQLQEDKKGLDTEEKQEQSR